MLWTITGFLFLPAGTIRFWMQSNYPPRIHRAQIKEILETEAMDATIYIAVDTWNILKKAVVSTAAAAAIGTVFKF